MTLSSDSLGETIQGSAFGTPPYMSPEQRAEKLIASTNERTCSRWVRFYVKS